MNDTVREWRDNAEQDYRAMQALRAADPGLTEAICFHAQQCAEKLMKCVLIAAQTKAPRTHDLVGLSQRIEAVHAGWSWDQDELEQLSRGAVELRYPSASPKQAEADAAVDVCERIRPPLLALLPP